MHYTLPGLRSKIEPVGLIEAISASIRFGIVSAPRAICSASRRRVSRC